MAYQTPFQFGYQIPTSWFQEVDILTNGVLQGAQSVAAVLAALGLTGAALITSLPLPIGQGGTGQVSSGAALGALGGLSITAFNAQFTQAGIGTVFIGESAAETAALAGMVPPGAVVNPNFAPGYVDRYGANTVPGTTDMGPALQAAITVALATGVAIRFAAGAYSIATLPTFGAVTGAMQTIDIGGVGLASQVINNAAAGAGAIFNMGGLNGWAIHDLLICGNSANKNDGIYAGTVGGTEQILWRVDNVTSMMAGVGLQVADTNDFVVRRFISWPNNPPVLAVPQAVTPSDIGHHIHITGGFVNLGSFYDCVCQPSHNFFGGTNAQRGCSINVTSSIGLVFVNCDFETYDAYSLPLVFSGAPSGQSGVLVSGELTYNTSGMFTFSDSEIRWGTVSNAGVCGWFGAITGSPTVNATLTGLEVGFSVTSSGAVQQLTMIGCDFEGTQIQLANCVQCNFIGLQDGASGGSLTLNAGCRNNNFLGVGLAAVLEASASNYGNLFENCTFRSPSWQDLSTTPVDRRINCLSGGALIRDWGGTDAVTVTIPSSSPNQTPNCWASNYYRYVENNTSVAFTINTPLNPVVGFELTIVIVNSSGGAGVQPTFSSGFHMTSNTPSIPSNGQEATYVFKYNGTTFQQLNTPATVVPD